MVCWSLRADILPAAEHALLPEAGRIGRRGPRHGIGRYADHIVSHPNALIGSAQPIGPRGLADEENRSRYAKSCKDRLDHVSTSLPEKTPRDLTQTGPQSPCDSLGGPSRQPSLAVSALIADRCRFLVDFAKVAPSSERGPR